jgi:membrane protease YdiL (CAAX protease family)
MTLSKRTALWISLGVIALYWGYSLVTSRTVPTIPSTFPALIWKITRVKLLVSLCLVLLLRLEGERFDALGVTSRDWLRHLGIGIAIGLGMFVAFNFALDSVLNSLIPRPPSTGQSIMVFFKQPSNLLVWIPISIFAGGIVEELERIFVLTRFEKWLGRPGLVLAVVISSVVFGLGHLYQGVGTAIGTGISGVVLSLVYLRKRSAIEAITAHAFSDILAVVAATFLSPK